MCCKVPSDKLSDVFWLTFCIGKRKYNIMRNILLLATFLFAQITLAQSQQNDLAFTAKAIVLPLFSDNRLGAEVGLRYYITDGFSVGNNYLYTNNSFKHGFGYDTNRTLMHYLGINIPLQYDVVNKDKFQVGMGVSPGLAISTLRDKTRMKEEEYYDEETGVTTVISTPVRLNRDAYFTLTPNIDFSVKIANLETKSNTNLYVTGNAGYQFAFGKGDFTKPSDFRNYVISLGFTIKGALD